MPVVAAVDSVSAGAGAGGLGGEGRADRLLLLPPQLHRGEIVKLSGEENISAKFTTLLTR